MTKKQLIAAYRKCKNAMNDLSTAQQNLSRLATEYYGEELNADICGGGEIEFRRLTNDMIDDFSCLRLEDIINKKLIHDRD